MKKIKILLYYIVLLLLIYKITYYIGTTYIFSCSINKPKDLDCLGIVFNSYLMSFSIMILFLIIDLSLFKSYKKFIK
ncbi:hypothetical protein EOM39_07765 [Candidatus Gracilibacteria bacterium]|nr:hypothetical protein [Candidatus Gracilibacteria bacterium]